MNSSSIQTFLSRYGTWIGILAAALTALLGYWGVMIPSIVWPILAASGITVYRSSLTLAGAPTGWKSYAAAFSIAVLAAMQAYGLSIPDWAWAIPGLFGAVGLHLAVQKIA